MPEIFLKFLLKNGAILVTREDTPYVGLPSSLICLSIITPTVITLFNTFKPITCGTQSD